MTRRGDGAAGRGGLVRAWCSPRSYGLVVVLIVVTYTLALVTDRFRTAAPLLLAQAGTVWLALWRSRARRRLRRWATVVVGLAVLGAAVDTLAGGRSRVAALAFAVATVLYLVAPLSIVGHIAVRLAASAGERSHPSETADHHVPERHDPDALHHAGGRAERADGFL